MMRVGGVLKAKNKALECLKEKYKGSKLKCWKSVNKMINDISIQSH